MVELLVVTQTVLAGAVALLLLVLTVRQAHRQREVMVEMEQHRPFQVHP
jgi:hypothetical protein